MKNILIEHFLHLRLISLWLIFSINLLFAQSVFEPSSSSVYDYLNRLSVKGIIVFRDEIRPLTRMLIASKLKEAEDNSAHLSKLEREELNFYKQIFFPELNYFNPSKEKNLTLFDLNKNSGFRIFLYRDSNFTFNVDPIFGLSFNSRYDEVQRHRRNGLEFYGYYKNNLGFSFYFKDNEEQGSRIDRTKLFSPEPGINPSKGTINTIEYLNVKATVSYTWEWGNLSLGKDNIEWGSGRRGKLILSNKAPSFPFIKLEFKPVDWLSFYYLHGWLQSTLIDSGSIRTTLVKGRESYSQREKYIAAHILSFYPSDAFSFSLGESIIYSDKLEFLYFIPVIFFRAADHYLSRMDSNSGDNAQVFANAVYKNTKLNSALYGTLFIDELSLSNLFKGEDLSSIAFTIGINIVDPGIIPQFGTELVIEYTRLNPFVYLNSNDAQLYTSHGYQLGHWIGSNADQFYVSLNLRILRGLQFNIWGEYIRRGQKELPEQQYQLPYPSLLYGPRMLTTNAGFQLSYEIVRNFFTKVSYQFSKITDQDLSRTPSYMLGKQHSFEIDLFYGM